MPAAEIIQSTWIDTIRALLEHHVPPLAITPGVIVGSLLALFAGIFLTFRGGKFERLVVCAFALGLGGWLGQRLSGFTSTPGPITIAVAAIVLSVIAYKTYRWWLAVGSVLVVFALAIVFQLGRADQFQENLLKLVDSAQDLKGGQVELVKDHMANLRNQSPDPMDELAKLKDSVLAELKEIGPTGWVIPIAAAIVGGLLAYWMLRAFAVVWLGFFGANLAVLGAAVALCALAPAMRNNLLAHPEYPAGLAIVLWLLGLIHQAKESRFPKKSAPAPEGDKGDADS